MTVSNHFDVRWVDGYSAVSDVPSSLAATIEKLAAELPSSHDRIEVAVRDVRRSDGVHVAVGLLRFVVNVSSVPRPLGFLHAAVLPAGYRADLDGWRALVARRYGTHPEERIRTLYEELAESTKEGGRDRLLSLAIRFEDVCELLEPLKDDESPIGGPRLYVRPPSRPPKGSYPRAASSPGVGGISSAPAASPKARPSQPLLPLSPMMQVVNLPDPLESRELDALRADQTLANDITQPMDAPPGTAAPLSGEHSQHRLPVARGQRGWWVAGTVLGAAVLLLGAMGWLMHRHRVLVVERDRLADQVKKLPDRDAWERERKRLEEALADALNHTPEACKKQVTLATESCEVSLNKARIDARTKIDDAEKSVDNLRNQLMDLSTRLALTTKAKDEAEKQYHVTNDAQRQLTTTRDALEAENQTLRATAEQRYKQLKALCDGLQSARTRPPTPKECQGIQ
ncbi:MAG TPA: hypothetical protein VNO30_28060 [Kofleriaceae bacterium]|nr:hypothetical protein [Kofleriaceae bacterium]